MSSDTILCVSCSNPFASNADLVKHFQRFQPSSKLLARLEWHKSQFQKLSSILQDLVAHREPGLDCDIDNLDDTDQKESCHESDKDTDTAQCFEARHSVRARKQHKPFKCPIPSCDAKRVRRKQELFRHFSTHYACEEICPCCSRTFHDGSKFMYHKCSMITSDDRTQYEYKRETVRKKIEEFLGFWNVKKHAKGAATSPNTDHLRKMPSPLLQHIIPAPQSQLCTEDVMGHSTDPIDMTHSGTAPIIQQALLPNFTRAVVANEYRVHDPHLECLFDDGPSSTQPMHSLYTPLEGFFDEATRHQYLMGLHDRNISMAQ